MTRIRTFIDACLLITAARGADELSELAIEILDDPNRDFVSSDFVRLEVLPKAIFNQQEDEAEFYRAFLDGAHTSVRSSAALVSHAQSEAEQAGLSAIDALHVAAAKEANCQELVTAERPAKPLFRVAGLNIATIRPPP